MHRILLEDGHKPSVEGQRRLNPTMKEVVRKEVLKWLDTGVINPISDSAWVSLVQVVPKKGGTTVIRTENNTLLPSRIVTDWRICIDYQKLNKATQKDHSHCCFWIRCWIDYPDTNTIAFWMDIPATIRLL